MTRYLRRRLVGIITSVGLAGGVALATGAYFTLETQRHHRARAAQELARRQAAWNRFEGQVDAAVGAFRQQGGQAGIVIRDLSTGWQLAHQADRRFAAASVVKIAIMAAAFQAAQDGDLSLTDTLQIKASDRVSGSGQLKHRAVGSRVAAEELIELMISQSDNIATNLLIDRLGMARLRQSFQTAGLRHTTLARKMMDFRARALGVENYTSAEDTALLLDAIYRNRLINAQWSARGMDLLRKQKLRDRIPANLPPETLVAHKTGLENHVCHDAGIVFTPRGDMLICVLTKHRDKTSRRAKAFIASVSRSAYDYLVSP